MNYLGGFARRILSIEYISLDMTKRRSILAYSPTAIAPDGALVFHSALQHVSLSAQNETYNIMHR